MRWAFAVTIAFTVFLSLATSVAAVLGPKGQPKEWTFLVYLNADNNLHRFGEKDFAEMERIGSTDQVNIVVQFDPETHGAPTTRYFVTKNPNSQPGRPTSQVLGTMAETDMGHPKTLSDFLAWGTKEYPAKKIALVVWNHGNGWEGISYDDNPATHLTTTDLRQALEGYKNLAQAAGRKAQAIDLIDFDACLMSSIEVAFEIKGLAKVMVGSQFLVPGDGNDYTRILAPLMAKPQMDEVEFSKVLVYQYAMTYPNSREISYLALDLSKIANFSTVFNDSATAMNAASTEIKNSLRRLYKNPAQGGFDMIRVLKSSVETTAADKTLYESLKKTIDYYGYPDDQITKNKDGEFVIRVVRYNPGHVYIGIPGSNNYTQVEMAQKSQGVFEAEIPLKIPMQYTVVGKTVNRLREAKTQVLRRLNGDPIIYHENFPPTSPVIADALSPATKGAHGMTLYSLAGLKMVQRGDPVGARVLNQYGKLKFAVNGAPQWTRFFGF